MNYHNFEKNLAKMNPRMAGSKNPRMEKLEKKMNQSNLMQNQMYSQMGQYPAGGMFPQQ